jgi:hypothetical protein
MWKDARIKIWLVMEIRALMITLRVWVWVTLRLANQFVLATSPLRLTTSNFIFQLNTCSCSPYVISSLTRAFVCHLQLLPVLVSAVIIRSRRLRQPGGPSPRIYIPHEQGGPVIPTGTGFPFPRLLRLAELRWRYSTPPPNGNHDNISES